MTAKNVTYQNPIHQEENTPLVTILETRVETKESTAVDSRKAQYVIDLTKASFGGISYPVPGTQWYLKKISGVWALMARAPRQNPQLDPSINPQPGETYFGNGGKTVFVGGVKTNGNLDVVGNDHVSGNTQVDGSAHVNGNAQVDGVLTLGSNTTFSMIGEIRMWPTIAAPTNWQLCDGTSLLRATYPTLFALLQPVLGTATMTIASPCVVSFTGHGLSIGDRVFFTTTGALPTGVSADTTYWVISAGFGANSFSISTTQGGSAVNTSGTQSGVHTLSRTYFGVADSTHFNAPDYRGRVPVGRDSSQTEFAAIGMTGGEKAHTLTTAEMPSHNHGGSTSSNIAYDTNAIYAAGGSNNLFVLSWGGAFVGGDEGYRNRTLHAHTVSSQGGDGAHNNIQPYVAINYIIKLL